MPEEGLLNTTAPETAPAPTEAAAPAAAPAANAEGLAAPPEKVEGQDTTKPAGAPEKYDFKAPEGMELDSALMEQFGTLAKEANLPQDHAQKLVDLYTAKVKDYAQQQQEAFTGIVKGWQDSAKSDKEFGGTAFDGSLKVAQSAMARFGTPELRQALAETGMANHPELIRIFWKVGKAMSEDTLPNQSKPPIAASAAKVLYPNMN